MSVVDRFVQLVPGSYKSEKHINIIGIDKIHLKCDCVDRSVLDDCRQSILYSFALDKPPGHKIYEKLRIKLFKKINKRVLSHIASYLEDNYHEPVDFIGETTSCDCQIIKIY